MLRILRNDYKTRLQFSLASCLARSSMSTFFVLFADCVVKKDVQGCLSTHTQSRVIKLLANTQVIITAHACSENILLYTLQCVYTVILYTCRIMHIYALCCIHAKCTCTQISLMYTHIAMQDEKKKYLLIAVLIRNVL